MSLCIDRYIVINGEIYWMVSNQPSCKNCAFFLLDMTRSDSNCSILRKQLYCIGLANKSVFLGEEQYLHYRVTGELPIAKS